MRRDGEQCRSAVPHQGTLLGAALCIASLTQIQKLNLYHISNSTPNGLQTYTICIHLMSSRCTDRTPWSRFIPTCYNLLISEFLEMPDQTSCKQRCCRGLNEWCGTLTKWQKQNLSTKGSGIPTFRAGFQASAVSTRGANHSSRIALKLMVGHLSFQAPVA